MRSALVALICCAALAFAAGWAAGRAPLHTAMATLKSNQAESDRLAAVAAARRLAAAQQRGDALAEQLLGREQLIGQSAREKRDAVAQTTRGHLCLNAGTLRVLDGAPGLRLSAPAQAASSPAATGEPIATDTGVAGWVVTAGAQYEQCRERLDRLIDWHEERRP